MVTSPDKPEANLDGSSPGAASPPLLPGDPAPWFVARSDVNPAFKFSSLGGRHIVIAFLPSFSKGSGATVFRAMLEGVRRFGTGANALLLVTADADDDGKSVPEKVGGVRYFFDFDKRIAKMFGVVSDAEQTFRPVSFILDERLRVVAIVAKQDVAGHAAQVFTLFDRLPAIAPAGLATGQAPVIVVPHVFEPGLCRKLVEGFEADGGSESGFMVEREGLTVSAYDPNHKRRTDWNMGDTGLIAACHVRIQRRLVPELARAFQFHATRIERNTVACYDAATLGHFAPHRDNTTKGTAHRRFAVSINLNSEEYEGGDLIFPEFGQTRFRPPTGGACVFSCSLLHQATAVTKGKRYVYVPFLYDDAAAEIRASNLRFLST